MELASVGPAGSGLPHPSAQSLLPVFHFHPHALCRPPQSKSTLSPSRFFLAFFYLLIFAKHLSSTLLAILHRLFYLILTKPSEAGTNTIFHPFADTVFHVFEIGMCFKIEYWQHLKKISFVR
jgi:hypothetical protein